MAENPLPEKLSSLTTNEKITQRIELNNNTIRKLQIEEKNFKDMDPKVKSLVEKKPSRRTTTIAIG